MRNLKKYAYFTCFGLLLSCADVRDQVKNGEIDHIDPYAKLNRNDFKDYLSPEIKGAAKNNGDANSVETKIETKVPPLPKISDVLLNPQKPKLSGNKTVSISVTEDVQLKDVFLELARLANVDIEVDPGIKGGVIFKATNKPFTEVIDRISDMANLRYSENGGVIRIERDLPYTENYQANFLNLIRKNNTNVDSNTSLSTGSGAKGAIENGSKSNLSYSNGNGTDLWGSLKNEITAIVTGNSDAKLPGDAYVNLNREAGIISVKTGKKNHAKIKLYLDQVKDLYATQVLIEAKVVEVSLSDQFRSGINWKVLSGLGKGISVDMTSIAGFPSVDLANDGSNITKLNLSRSNGDISAAVDLAQVFGTTRTLSSPRIMVMNNQQAVLSFAKNETYFAIKCSFTDAVYDSTGTRVTTPAKSDITSQQRDIPIGVILNLQPSIDSKGNEVSLSVRPTLTRLTGKVYKDPAVDICAKQASAAGGTELRLDSSIPQVDVREMDSVLRLKSGEVMAIGGMIDQKDRNTDTGVPWVSVIPILGNAFKTADKQNEVIQTVIFLKATIVPGYGVDEKDQEMYNKFVTDPHPVKF